MFVPYACGWCHEDIVETFYLTDYKSSDEMIGAAFNKLLAKRRMAIINRRVGYL